MQRPTRRTDVRPIEHAGGYENPIPYSVEVLHRSKQTFSTNPTLVGTAQRAVPTVGEGGSRGAAASDLPPLAQSRSVLLAVEMKEGNIIGQFNETARGVIDTAKERLPEGVEVLTLSDQRRPSVIVSITSCA